MTISISKKSRRRSAYTLLEILMAMGLCAILAAVSIPAMEGWWSEHKMRMKASELIDLVRTAKLEAEKTGTAQMVVLLRPEDQAPISAAANLHYLRPDSDYTWSMRGFLDRPTAQTAKSISIDSRGYVEPVSFRISSGDKYMEYRFDFLTGFAQEEGFSF